jgi:N-acetylneuraminic acid mutarotase
MLAYSDGPSLPFGRAGHAGANLDGVVVVSGGTSWSDDKTVKSYLRETLKLSDGSWKQLSPAPDSFAESACASSNGELFVAGGQRAVGQPVSRAFKYSLATDRWIELDPLPVKVVAGAGVIRNGQFLVIGGLIDDKPSNRVFAIDTRDANAKWVELATLPVPGRAYAAAVAMGNTVYCLGGLAPDPAGRTVYRDVLCLEPDKQNWELCGQLPAPGYCWAASEFDSHQVLVTGRADGAIHDDVWIVNLENLSCQSGGTLATPNTCAPLIRVNTSAFWMLGGEPSSNKVRTARVQVIER